MDEGGKIEKILGSGDPLKPPLKLEIYSRHTETPPEVIADIIHSAEKAYEIVGRAKGIPAEEMNRTNYCVEVVDNMMAELLSGLKKGYLGATIDVSFRFVDHQYMSIYPPKSQRRIIADPTWQQFLPADQRTSDKPKVLIGTSEEVGKQLLEYGFRPDQVRPWTG